MKRLAIALLLFAWPAHVLAPPANAQSTVTVVGPAPVPGNCVEWFSTTQIKDPGVTCNGGGGGGPGGSSGQVQYNNAGTFGGLTNPQLTALALPGTCIVGTGSYASITAALAVCSSNSTILVTTNQTLSAGVSVTGAGITLTCQPGVVITVNTAVTITVTGARFSATDCQYVGPGAATTNSAQLYEFEADYITFARNIVSAFGVVGGTIGQRGIVEWISGSHGKTFNNTFHNNGDINIEIITNTAPTDFVFYGNQLTDLLIEGDGPTTQIQDVRIFSNYFRAGEIAATTPQNLCVWLDFIINLTFTGNTCDLVGNVQAGVGGTYSFSDQTDITVTGNILRQNGFTYQDYSFEFNQIKNAMIAGNYAEANFVSGNGYSCEACNNVTFTGNSQVGWKSATSAFQFVESVSSYSNQSKISIIGNTALADSSAINIFGLIIEDFTHSILDTDFIIANNVFVGGVTPAGSIAIFINGDTGSPIQVVLAGPNAIRSFGVGVDFGSQVTDFCYVTGANYATTATSGAGGSGCF